MRCIAELSYNWYSLVCTRSYGRNMLSNIVVYMPYMCNEEKESSMVKKKIERKEREKNGRVKRKHSMPAEKDTEKSAQTRERARARERENEESEVTLVLFFVPPPPPSIEPTCHHLPHCSCINISS